MDGRSSLLILSSLLVVLLSGYSSLIKSDTISSLTFSCCVRRLISARYSRLLLLALLPRPTSLEDTLSNVELLPDSATFLLLRLLGEATLLLLFNTGSA